MKEERKIAYIFEDVGGWYVCDNDTPYLDTREEQECMQGKAQGGE